MAVHLITLKLVVWPFGTEQRSSSLQTHNKLLKHRSGPKRRASTGLADARRLAGRYAFIRKLF